MFKSHCKGINFIDMKSTVIYINPEFQEMLDFVPKYIARKVDLSFVLVERNI